MNDTTERGTRRHVIGTLIATYLIASCASQTSARGDLDAEPDVWSGRLGLVVASEPPQSFSAGFNLSGNPQAGELSLTSPLGSTLAVLRWQPGQAWLHQGEQVRSYDSLDALAAEVTGTPLPVRALFAWLRGTPEAVEGWQVDLRELNNGRLSAERLMPLPTAQLRVVLDR